MGQITSTEPTEKVKYQEFISNYQFLRRIRDPRYGEIGILEDRMTKEQVALKEIISKDNQDFEKELKYLTARFRITHPNILRILGFTSKSEEKLCASFHKIFMIVEYLESDLEREIYLKKHSGQFYSEEQLWYLTESMVKALAVLQSNYIVHGDIKPSTIFVSKMGVYKVAEHNILGNVMPGYHQRLLGYNDNRTYLSPALLINLVRGEAKPAHHPWKSDVFSLGMTLLHAATLTNCDNIYNWDLYSINTDLLQSRLKIVKEQYSVRLYNMISSMLIYDEDRRPDFKSLDSQLNEEVEKSQLPLTRPLREIQMTEDDLDRPISSAPILTTKESPENRKSKHQEETANNTAPTMASHFRSDKENSINLSSMSIHGQALCMSNDPVAVKQQRDLFKQSFSKENARVPVEGSFQYPAQSFKESIVRNGYVPASKAKGKFNLNFVICIEQERDSNFGELSSTTVKTEDFHNPRILAHDVLTYPQNFENHPSYLEYQFPQETSQLKQNTQPSTEKPNMNKSLDQIGDFLSNLKKSVAVSSSNTIPESKSIPMSIVLEKESAQPVTPTNQESSKIAQTMFQEVESKRSPLGIASSLPSSNSTPYEPFKPPVSSTQNVQQPTDRHSVSFSLPQPSKVEVPTLNTASLQDGISPRFPGVGTENKLNSFSNIGVQKPLISTSDDYIKQLLANSRNIIGNTVVQPGKYTSTLNYTNIGSLPVKTQSFATTETKAIPQTETQTQYFNPKKDFANTEQPLLQPSNQVVSESSVTLTQEKTSETTGAFLSRRSSKITGNE